MCTYSLGRSDGQEWVLILGLVKIGDLDVMWEGPEGSDIKRRGKEYLQVSIVSRKNFSDRSTENMPRTNM